MVTPYLWLNKGDPVKVISQEYDSGYPVCIVEDSDGNRCKPLRTEVMAISTVHEQLKNHQLIVEEYQAILDRLSNKLADIQSS